ncbi:MAG: hypothetical protein HN548_07295 [Opitutae bacterium]|nr:hypothetical protein [Opitutae bacterium]
MKKTLWVIVSFIVVIALVDLFVFEWWLPQRFSKFLEGEMVDGQLSFEDIEIDWLEGRLIGGELETSQWKLALGDGSFSYSSFDWFLGNEFEIKHLELRGLTIKSSSDLDSNVSILGFLNKLRLNPLNLGCDSIEVNGKLEVGGVSIPFSFFGSQIKSTSEIKSAIEFRLDESPSFLRSFSLGNSPVLIKAFISKEIKDKRQVLKVSALADHFFRLDLTNDGELESIMFIIESSKQNASSGRIVVNRKRGDAKFYGDWNGTILSADLVKYVPILSLVNAGINGGGTISFDAQGKEMDLDVIAGISASSIFFPKEGTLKGDIRSRIQLMDKKWTTEEFSILIKNEKGEKIELLQDELFENSEKSSKFNLVLTDFELGRFGQHFSKDAIINGIFSTGMNEDSLQLDSNDLHFSDSEVEQQNISMSLTIPLKMKSEKGKGIKFDCRILPNVEISSHFIPRVIKQSKRISFQNLSATGHIERSGWSVNHGSLEMANNQGRVGQIQMKNSFISHVDGNGFKWSQVNPSSKQETVFNINSLGTNFSLGIQNLELIGSFKDLNGEIIFVDGYPKLLCKNFIFNGRLEGQNSNVFNKVQIKGDLKFDPRIKNYDQFHIERLEVIGDDKKIATGELLFSLDQNAQVVQLKSVNLDANLSTLRFHPFSEILHIDNQKIEANKFEWELSEGTELKFDGLLELSLANSSDFLKIPVNWTFVEKNEDTSHWVQMSYIKDLKSDLEINFQSDSNLISFRGDRLNVVDLLPFFKNMAHNQNQSQTFGLSNFVNQFKQNVSLSLKTLIISPLIKLKDVEAEFNNLNKTISFSSKLRDSILNGEVIFQTLEENSSKFVMFKLQVNGLETNATIINIFESSNVLTDGLIDWNLEVKGILGGNYKTKIVADFTNLSFNLLGEKKGDHVSVLKSKMENSLGNSFSWSAPQTKMIEVLSVLLENIYFRKGSFELNRSDLGNWKFSFKDWTSLEFNLFGSAEYTPKGKFKINIFPSVKGKWANFLQVANLLAVGKNREGYRTLKKEPLVFEGSNYRWNLANWWNVFAQGIGLEPSE